MDHPPGDPKSDPQSDAAGLRGLRARIDAIDDELLDLLERRAALVEDVAAHKRAQAAPRFHDPERERQILERLSARAGRLSRGAIQAIYREIISACLALEQPQRVAYLGPEGTFSHMAARYLFGLSARYREVATIPAVFDAVRGGDAAFGVVPFENSSEGGVTQCADALLEGDLRIQRELVLDISHSLLSLAPGLSQVRRVYSHPQALAQCRDWLQRNLPGAPLLPSAATAAAVREALQDREAAAIGSTLAGELHGVPVLAERIQDRPENATRFLVLAESDAPPSGDDRTTCAFTLHDQRGALQQALSVLAEAGINLTRIESRPSRRRPFDYAFLIDLCGHRQDPQVAQALDVLRQRCEDVRVLGSYPRCRLSRSPEKSGASG